MATIGVSKPYIAKYTNNNGTITYSEGQILAKAVEFSAAIENGEINNFYADNGLAEDAAVTQGEAIEWQTPKLEGSIMRDDSVKHAWKREATFDTEANAETYIKQVLHVKDNEQA